MAKFVTTKYGTKINVDGLNPAQVKQVLSTAQDKGAYGAKGTALADTFRKKNATPTPTPTPTTPGVTEDPNYLNKNGKIVDPNAVVDKVASMTPGATDLAGDVKAARDAAYNYSTQYYARDKAKEVEDQKQELANRGIPLDFKEGSLYAESVGNIDRKYQGMYDQANNQAIAQGNQILGTEAGVGQGAASSFLQAVLGMSDIELQKFGITQDMKAKMAAIAKSGSSNSGGSTTTDTSPIIGGLAPGVV